MEGQADDYAFMAWGLLELHQATLDPRWLEACEALLRAARPRFFDEADGLIFAGGVEGDRHLPARIKDAHDNVEPAPASVFADVQLRLWGLGLGEGWRADAERALKGHLRDLARAPRSLPFMAAALARALDPPRRLVVAGSLEDEGTQALLAVGRARWLPDLDRIQVDPSRPLPGWAAGFTLVDQRPAAYLCRDFACDRPVTEVDRLKDALGIAK